MRAFARDIYQGKYWINDDCLGSAGISPHPMCRCKMTLHTLSSLSLTKSAEQTHCRAGSAEGGSNAMMETKRSEWRARRRE